MDLRRRLQVSDAVSEDDYPANPSNAKEIRLVDSVERKYLAHLMHGAHLPPDANRLFDPGPWRFRVVGCRCAGEAMAVARTRTRLARGQGVSAPTAACIARVAVSRAGSGSPTGPAQVLMRGMWTATAGSPAPIAVRARPAATAEAAGRCVTTSTRPPHCRRSASIAARCRPAARCVARGRPGPRRSAAIAPDGAGRRDRVRRGAPT